MSGKLIGLCMMLMAGCAKQTLSARPGAPNPSGCYIFMYDQPGFRGTGDVLNGPGQWLTLDNLRGTNLPSWRGRIRSVRVGTISTVVIYSDEKLGGRRVRLEPGSEHADIETLEALRVASLEMSCQ